MQPIEAPTEDRGLQELWEFSQCLAAEAFQCCPGDLSGCWVEVNDSETLDVLRFFEVQDHHSQRQASDDLGIERKDCFPGLSPGRFRSLGSRFGSSARGHTTPLCTVKRILTVRQSGKDREKVAPIPEIRFRFFPLTQTPAPSSQDRCPSCRSCRTIGDIPRTEGLTPESVSRRQQQEPLDLSFPSGGALVGDLGGLANLQLLRVLQTRHRGEARCLRFGWPRIPETRNQVISSSLLMRVRIKCRVFSPQLWLVSATPAVMALEFSLYFGARPLRLHPASVGRLPHSLEQRSQLLNSRLPANPRRSPLS